MYGISGSKACELGEKYEDSRKQKYIDGRQHVPH